jgi:hypothetical protein
MIYDFFNIGKLIDSDGVHSLYPLGLNLNYERKFLDLFVHNISD